jgi:hypothetical protein
MEIRKYRLFAYIMSIIIVVCTLGLLLSNHQTNLQSSAASTTGHAVSDLLPDTSNEYQAVGYAASTVQIEPKTSTSTSPPQSITKEQYIAQQRQQIQQGQQALANIRKSLGEKAQDATPIPTTGTPDEIIAQQNKMIADINTQVKGYNSKIEEKKLLQERAKESRDAQKALSDVEHLTDQLIGNTIQKYLGPYAYGWIDEVCKDKWESSEPESTEPHETSSDPGVNTQQTISPSTQQQIQEAQTVTASVPTSTPVPSPLVPAVCQDMTVTTMNVYAIQQTTGQQTTGYLVSYTIQTCNSGWGTSEFTVTLQGQDTITVDSGTVPYGTVKSSQKNVQTSNRYSQVCISVNKEPGLSPYCNQITMS